MSKEEELQPYLNREHALVKHKLFERYFKRFIMILGVSKHNISYVDAFAGPWKSADENYGDTSFGRAIQAIESCSIFLAQKHGKRPRFRSLLIEADKNAFEELDRYARFANKSTSTVEAWNVRFQESIGDILNWIRPGEKTFVLIDPKAYRGLISPKVLSPLLKNPNVEVLINYMWQFINLAIGHASNEKHDSNLRDLFGDNYLPLTKLPPGEKEREFIKRYRARLIEESGLDDDKRPRVAAFPVEYANRDGTKYYLVYGTHSSRGLIAFSEASEEAMEDQSDIRYIIGQKKREELTGVPDMFGNSPESGVQLPPLEKPWLELLPSKGSCVRIDENKWANLLDTCDCLPSQLQRGLKNLLERGIVEVEGATKRRTKNFVNWKKAEVVRRLT